MDADKLSFLWNDTVYLSAYGVEDDPQSDECEEEVNIRFCV